MQTKQQSSMSLAVSQFARSKSTFEKWRSSKKAPKINKCTAFLATRPKWIWGLATLSFSIIALGALAGILVIINYNPTATASLPTYPLNSTAGKPCTFSSDCITNASCIIPSGQNTGTCVCATLFYFNPTTATCVARKANGVACTYNYECIEVYNFQCISSICQCNTQTMFLNSTINQCQYLKTPFSLCSSSSECITNSACSNSTPLSNIGFSRCLCSSGYWYNSANGVCEQQKPAGASCTVDFECVSGAYCAKLSTGANICACDSKLYNYNGQCNFKYQGYMTSCSLIDQCNLNQNNLRCISGSCRCDSTSEYWDAYALKCSLLKTYGQTCITASDCISSLTCTYPAAAIGGNRKACICPSGLYFDWITGTCLASKSYNSICNARAECVNPDTMVCSTQNGGTTKRCLCAPNLGYQSGTTCVMKKSRSSLCSNSFECQEYLGFVCTGSVCNCPSNTLYNSLSGACEPMRRKNDLCSSNSQCTAGSCGTCGSVCGTCSWCWYCGCGSCYGWGCPSSPMVCES